MIRKRAIIKDLSSNSKKLKLKKEDNSNNNLVPSDTKSALAYISNIFPSEKFTNKLPPIVMRHQIYAFVACRTDVDRELNEMRKKGEVRLFKLGNKDDNIGVVYAKDYKDHVEKCCKNSQRVGNFLKKVVSVCPEYSYSHMVLKMEFGFTEEDIVELVQQGVLTCRDVGCYWLSIPRVGEFMKTFFFGRRAILQYVRRTKYKEILKKELEQRKLPKQALLGVMYHIYDIIGSESVSSFETSTGTMLRLQPEPLR